jgi:hypothetical protein
MLSSGRIDQQEYEKRLVEWISIKVEQTLEGNLPSKEEAQQSRAAMLNDLDEATSIKLGMCEEQEVEVGNIELTIKGWFDKSLRIFRFEKLDVSHGITLPHPVQWLRLSVGDSSNG